MSRSHPPADAPRHEVEDPPSHVSPCDGPLSLRVHEKPTLTLVTPVGELDLSTADTFDRRLWEAQTQATHVVLDLRVLAFIDSAGLRSLVAARLRATQAHHRLEVICGPGQVRRMLSCSGLDRLVEIIEPPAPLRVVRGAQSVAA